ncbi:isoprenyl transferase [Leuconostoc fallax]|uniref:isoprenyl transferase n=1 Tax=Leuconostoc fallax TaxID=1251 RepID=UPI003CCFF6ED
MAIKEESVLALFNSNSDTDSVALKIPNHIAIIMDGNGRWAKKRFMPRVAGHKAGMNTVKRIAIAAQKLGVKVLTLYAFSTENWLRPTDEVSFLMQLPIDFFNDFVPDLVKNDVRVEVMGDIDALPSNTQKAVRRAITLTRECQSMVLNFALNYGGQQEIVNATRQIATLVQSGQLAVEDIDKQAIESVLATHQLGEYAMPDLMIRTSGELRTSNFMPYQLAYSELYFTDKFWPDFTDDDLKTAVLAYTKRDRRFGGLKK